MSKGSWHSQEFERPEFVDVPDEPRPQRGRKNTKRWCKGKVGREHQPETVVNHQYTTSNWTECHESRWMPNHWSCRHAVQCTVCGKYVKTWLGREECPAWLAQQK